MKANRSNVVEIGSASQGEHSVAVVLVKYRKLGSPTFRVERYEQPNLDTILNRRTLGWFWTKEAALAALHAEFAKMQKELQSL